MIGIVSSPVNLIDLEKSRLLLNEVFKNAPKFESTDYLKWQYNCNPSGNVIQKNTDISGNRIAHYALVPQRWVNKGNQIGVALSLNTAVSLDHRKSGFFTELASAAFNEARQKGCGLVLGVANQNSTHGFVNRLGFKFLGPLDTRFLTYRSTRSTRSIEQLQLPEAKKFLSEINTFPSLSNQMTRIWDADEFEWRISCPEANYNFFSVSEALVISTVTKYYGIPISVILKVFTKNGADQIDLQTIASSACRLQRTYIAIYSGINNQIRITGSQLPVKLRPSPLNLIIKQLDNNPLNESVNLSQFEFLDFDAY